MWVRRASEEALELKEQNNQEVMLVSLARIGFIMNVPFWLE